MILREMRSADLPAVRGLLEQLGYPLDEAEIGRRFAHIAATAGHRVVVATPDVVWQTMTGSDAVVIGPGRAVTDLYYDCAKVREVNESGALLIRPDKHIAWRSMTMPADPRAALSKALVQILGRANAV